MQHSKKKIALIDFDMSVTGGVEFVTSSLAKALSDEFDVYVIGIYEKNGSPVYDLSGIKEYISLGCKS